MSSMSSSVISGAELSSTYRVIYGGLLRAGIVVELSDFAKTDLIIRCLNSSDSKTVSCSLLVSSEMTQDTSFVRACTGLGLNFASSCACLCIT